MLVGAGFVDLFGVLAVLDLTCVGVWYYWFGVCFVFAVVCVVCFVMLVVRFVDFD